MILCGPNADEDAGDCYGFCFVYSGNFTASAQQDQRKQTRVQMGIHPTFSPSIWLPARFSARRRSS